MNICHALKLLVSKHVFFGRDIAQKQPKKSNFGEKAPAFCMIY